MNILQVFRTENKKKAPQRLPIAVFRYFNMLKLVFLSNGMVATIEQLVKGLKEDKRSMATLPSFISPETFVKLGLDFLSNPFDLPTKAANEADKKAR
jgi:hypothetical protein